MENRDMLKSRVMLLRRLQWIAPVLVLVAAALVYGLYPDEDMKLILVGVLVVIAASDFFIFKMLADKAENSL